MVESFAKPSISMIDLNELFMDLEKLFNSASNSAVAVNIFNSFSQRKDTIVQDFAIAIELLFSGEYPRERPNLSVFLTDPFISGLVHPLVIEQLRILSLAENFWAVANSAMPFSATLCQEYLTLQQHSLAWKMAASNSYLLLTKMLHDASIQELSTEQYPQGEILAIKTWRLAHKTDKHYALNVESRVNLLLPQILSLFIIDNLNSKVTATMHPITKAET